MAVRTDIEVMDPVLELTIRPRSLTCTGTLNRLTCRHVLEAVDTILLGKPPRVSIDVSGVRITDVDGGNALVAVEEMVQQAGARLQWIGTTDDGRSDGLAVTARTAPAKPFVQATSRMESHAGI